MLYYCVHVNAQAASTRLRPTLFTWSSSVQHSSAVRDVALSDGVRLVLSRFAAGGAASYHHEEDADVIAVAIHLKGGASFQMEGAAFTTRPGDIWAGTSPRGSTSAFCLPASGFETVSLRLTPDLARDGQVLGTSTPNMLRRLAQAAGNEVAVTSERASKQLALLAGAMLASPYKPGSDTMFLEACSRAFLAGLDHEGPEAAKASTLLPSTRLEHARELLEDQHLAPPSISVLARATGTNEFTLKRAFKEAYGTTIHAYVRRYRMERAAERLDEGLSVQEAAAAVGYMCPRCFADAFRRTLGVLPSAVSRRRTAISPDRHS